GSCAAPSAKGDDKFITTDYLQQCQKVGRRRALEALRVPLWSVLSFACTAPGFSVVKWQFCYRSVFSAHRITGNAIRSLEASDDLIVIWSDCCF
ncbi:hypothetical protein, partial [Escherichia coli]|uniref:hypothetical protein n=1 Tax=Escherichia coli TaxID=562 RepID=UPI001BC83C23